MDKIVHIKCSWCKKQLEDIILKGQKELMVAERFCDAECMRCWWAYGNSPLRTYDGTRKEDE